MWTMKSIPIPILEAWSTGEFTIGPIGPGWQSMSEVGIGDMSMKVRILGYPPRRRLKNKSENGWRSSNPITDKLYVRRADCCRIVSAISNEPVSTVMTGTLVFNQADRKTISVRFVSPYPYADDITVNLRVNDGEWHSIKLSCQYPLCKINLCFRGCDARFHRLPSVKCVFR
jgi:hypothetical protein